MMLAFCIILLPAVSRSAENTMFSPYIENYPVGWIDWDHAIIYGTGRAHLDVHGNSRPTALRAARVIASGSILKLAAGLRLDERRTLESLGKGRVVIQLRAFLRVKDHKVEFIEGVKRPYYEVTRLTPISGVEGLTTKLLNYLKSTPHEWRDFPKRSTGTELGDEDKPWLVLDARKLSQENRAQPALFPKVSSTTGETLYELKKVDEAAMIKRGMARYVAYSKSQGKERSEKGVVEHIFAKAGILLSAKEAIAGEKRKRRKRRKFIVKEVRQVQGLMKTNLVISEKDAIALKAKDAATQILKKCRLDSQ